MFKEHDVLINIKVDSLRWAGHVARKAADMIPQNEVLDEARCVGRAKLDYADYDYKSLKREILWCWHNIETTGAVTVRAGHDLLPGCIVKLDR